MSVNYIKARQKQRTATSTEWQSANPNLLVGELAIESDTGRIKAGDGSTSYNSLPFLCRPVTASVTIAASAWQNSQYTVANDNITADSVVLMDAAVGISSTAFLALANAAIFCASQTDGQLVLQAAGTVPTVDVTIVLAIF